MGKGKLKFKGDVNKKAKKKKSTSSKKKSSGSSSGAIGGHASFADNDMSTQHQADTTATITNNNSLDSKPAAAAVAQQQNEGPKISTGQGLITTSSTVVSGHGTSFKTELRVGDAIIVQNEKGVEEMRVITMVLSSVSISLSSSFSTNVKRPSSYKYIIKPRNDKRDKARKIAMQKAEKEEIETRAQGTYGGEKEIVYREKTAHGGYRIRKEQASSDMGRSDLLAFRSKKKSDRYC